MDIQLVTRIAEELCKKRGWGEPHYIDAGASAAVFRVEHPDFGIAALKVYDPSFFEGDNAVIEERRIELQSAATDLRHPNLIHTYLAEKSEAHSTWFLLMNFCPWPSLQKSLSGVPVEEVPNLIKQLAEVVLFLQSHDIVHRDIKPANIVVSPDFKTLILLDLGVMRSISFAEGNGTDVGEKRRFVATAQYSPPEYITRDEEKGEGGFDALNIYQVGAVLHDLVMKRPLFADEAESLNRYRLYSAIVQKVPWIDNPSLPARLLSLCRSALQKDPGKRMSSVQLEDFTKADETAEDLRKRLAPRRRARLAQPPLSVIPWSAKIGEWIASAAVMEKDVLGPHAIADGPIDHGHQYDLSFDDLGVSVQLTLAVEDGALELLLRSSKTSPAVRILRVSAEGPDIPEDQISTQLRDQLLYALDTIPHLSDIAEDKQ